jgi:hypothetical protein
MLVAVVEIAPHTSGPGFTFLSPLCFASELMECWLEVSGASRRKLEQSERDVFDDRSFAVMVCALTLTR